MSGGMRGNGNGGVIMDSRMACGGLMD